MTPWHEQVERLLDVGRHREAKERLGEAFRDHPGDPDLHVLAARAAEMGGDVTEARTQLAHALSVDPRHFNARVFLHAIETDAQNYAVAEELITGLIREVPRNAALLASYARLMLLTLHLDKARALVDEALRVDPQDEAARLVDVLLCIVEGDRGRADAQLEDLVVEDPDGYEVANLLLVALIDEKRNREALALARQMLRADPDDEELVEIIVDLRAATHWMAWPLWPLVRFGWAGSAALWLGAVLVLQAARRLGGGFGFAFAMAYLAYAVYSWIYTPLMRAWLRRRGV